jgi:hypothetical protein
LSPEIEPRDMRTADHKRLISAPPLRYTRLQLQAVAPSVICRNRDGLAREVAEARLQGAMLTAIPLVLADLACQTSQLFPANAAPVGWPSCVLSP